MLGDYYIQVMTDIQWTVHACLPCTRRLASSQYPFHGDTNTLFPSHSLDDHCLAWPAQHVMQIWPLTPGKTGILKCLSHMTGLAICTDNNAWSNWSFGLCNTAAVPGLTQNQLRFESQVQFHCQLISFPGHSVYMLVSVLLLVLYLHTEWRHSPKSCKLIACHMGFQWEMSGATIPPRNRGFARHSTQKKPINSCWYM